MDRDSYVYKTPASKLVQVAAIAAEYKGRPDMLMTVIIRGAEGCVGIFQGGGVSHRQGDGYSDEQGVQFHHLLCDAVGKTEGALHCPDVQERAVPRTWGAGSRSGAGGSARHQHRGDDRGRKVHPGILSLPGTL